MKEYKNQSLIKTDTEYKYSGQLKQVTDAAGVRSVGYDAYGDPETDSLQVGNHAHLITEQKDVYGRSTGYIYARSGAAQHTVSIAYGTDGRIVCSYSTYAVDSLPTEIFIPMESSCSKGERKYIQRKYSLLNFI